MQNRTYILIYLTTLFLTGNLFAQEMGFIPYKQHKKWVVLNDSCQIISKEKYDTVCLMTGGLSRAKQKSKWGYLNKNCDVVIPLIYDTIYNFDRYGMAIAKEKGKWGYLNKNCDVVIPLIYDSIGNFDGYGMAKVKQKGKWGFIDKKNKIVIPIIYDAFGSFHEVYKDAQVRKDDSVYYINRKGEWVDIKKTRNYAVCGGPTMDVGNCIARVIKKDGLFGLIAGFCTENEKKDTIVPCKYSKVIYKGGSLRGLYEMDTPYKSPYHDESCAILLDRKYSLYNVGERKMWLADCDTMCFYGNWILYTKQKATGFIPENDKMPVEVNYKTIKIISTNFIYITDDKNQSYYINSKGKKFIPKIN